MFRKKMKPGAFHAATFPGQHNARHETRYEAAGGNTHAGGL
jgi:hypothetical protein